MNYSKAIKVAIESLRKERKDYAVDANLFKLFNATGSTQENAAKKVAEIDEAISVLNGTPRLL